jgi:hypothetical protein
MGGPLPPETIGELTRRTQQELHDFLARFEAMVPTGTRVLLEPGELATMIRETHGQITLYLQLWEQHRIEYMALRKEFDDQKETLTEVRGAFALVSRIGVLLIALILASMAFGAYIVTRGGHP